MAMLAVAIHILPGKLDAWKSVVLDQMTGENKIHTDQIRENAGGDNVSTEVNIILGEL